MNDRDSPAPSWWPTVRHILLVGLGIAIGAGAVWLATRPPQRTSDDFYAYHLSISRAEKLALTCHYKKPDQLTDLNRVGSDGSDFQDVWGQPFRYARVPTAGGEDVYVWTDWAQDDGRVFVVGAKVTADGNRVSLGHPPKD